MKTAQVAKEKVGGHVVGNVDVDAVVVVEVGGQNAQSAAAGVNEARLSGHVDERSAAVIAEDVIGKRRKVARAAVVIASRLLVGADRRFFQVKGEVMADIEVEIAVAVQVGPGC